MIAPRTPACRHLWRKGLDPCTSQGSRNRPRKGGGGGKLPFRKGANVGRERPAHVRTGAGTYTCIKITFATLAPLQMSKTKRFYFNVL
jgi:hypothetical protein